MKAKQRKEKKRKGVRKEGEAGEREKVTGKKKFSTTKYPPIEDWLGKLKLCPYNVLSYSKYK